jgi:hypothetical protein
MTQTQSREVVIREEEFGRLLADALRELNGWLNAELDEPELLDVAPVMVGLAQRAHALESFLDDYGARQNRTFVTLGELTASVRGLAVVKATALHASGPGLTARDPCAVDDGERDERTGKHTDRRRGQRVPPHEVPEPRRCPHGLGMISDEAPGVPRARSAAGLGDVDSSDG